MDIARLGLAVDSSQVEKGTVSLHQLTGAAGQASAASQRLAGASQAEAAGHRVATVASQAHTAAITAQNAIMRSSMQQRTMMIYQLNDVAVSLASGMNPAMVAMQQGSQILQGGLMPAIRTLLDLGKSLVVTFWPVAAVIGAVSVGVAGLAYEINKTADVQVGFFDVALAGWQLLAEQVAAWVAPVFSAIGSWLQQGWNAAAPVLKTIGNAIIGTFVFAFDAVKVTWGMLPAAIGDLTYQAADNLVFGVQYMIRTVQVEINKFLASIDQQLQGAGLPTLGLNIGAITPQHIANPYAGYADEYGMEMGAASTAFEVDYMGNAMGALSERAEEIALARTEVEALGEAVGGASEKLKAANDNIWGMTDALGALGPASVDPLTMLRTQMTDLDGLLAKGKISWEEYGEAAFRANSGAASSVLGLASGMTGALAQMFQDNKAFAIANAVVSTAEAVMKAMATYGPTPWGFAAAGVAAAAGAAQIATIMSASPGGGSAGSVRAPSGATTQNAPQRQQAERAPDRMDITLHGLDRNAMYTGDNIERLISLIEERSADGRIINLKVA